MDDKEYIDVTFVIVGNRVLIVSFIRCITIMMYNCIPLGAKYFLFQYGNSS